MMTSIEWWKMNSSPSHSSSPHSLQWKTGTVRMLSTTFFSTAPSEQALAIVDELRAYHLLNGVAVAGAGSADLERFVRAHFEWLDELVKGLSVVGELSPRSMDSCRSIRTGPRRSTA